MALGDSSYITRGTLNDRCLLPANDASRMPKKVSPHRPYADGGLRRKVIMREHRAHLAVLLCKAGAKRQKSGASDARHLFRKANSTPDRE